MKSSLHCLVALVLVSIGYGAINPTSIPTPLTAKEIAQGYREHVIIARPRAVHRASVDSEESRENIRVREKLPRFGDLRIIDLDPSDNADAAVARLRATGRYDFVEPDYLRSLQRTPNDTRFVDGSLWALNNTGQGGGLAGADIEALAAWDTRTDASDVIVAVVDTGVNLTHQDLAGNLWTNPSPTRGDLRGANFVGGRGSFVSGDPTDDDGHGTHIAGTIGAVGDNGFGVTGIAWRVKIMAVKVFPPNASGSVSEIAAGVHYAIQHGAHIINASYGAESSTGFSQTEITAINAARNAGIIFVAAAGNEAADMDISRFYPASHSLDNIVTVGASTRLDDLAPFSNHGAAVDIYAPGYEIVSLSHSSNTGLAQMSGTSMAAPHVAGALALLKAQFPTENYRQLINRLLRGAEPGARFASRSQTGGRLNLLRALATTTNRPFNDDFAERPRFTRDNLAIRASNEGATTEAGEPAHAGFAPSATLWWEWISPATGTVSIDTNGSAYDTVLHVYTGNTVGGLTPVLFNDNDAGRITSRITFTAQAGVAYQIAVGGKGASTGLTLLGIGTIPSNDAFATPVTLSGSSTHVNATNAHCSAEAGEPRVPGFNVNTSLWYKWTAPRNGRFQVSAFSDDFDPLLGVYTGTALASLTTVSTSDNTGVDNTVTGALCTIEASAGATYMIAVDSKSATAVGEFTLSITDSLWQSATGRAITGPPAVADDGTVYVGSTDSTVYAFSPEGGIKWTFATGGMIDTASPAVSDDGTVYAGSNDGKLYALDATGNPKWTHNFNSGGTTYGAGSSPAIAADGTIYLRVTDGYLYALNPTDGSEKWKVNVNASTSGFYGNPIVAPDGTIYQSSDDSAMALYALNPNGTIKWQFTADGGTYGAPALDAAGNIYFATITGGVYALSPQKTQLWKVTSGGNISSSIALSADGRTLYYAGYDSKLYARDTETGTLRWAYPLAAEVRASSPAVDGNGIIYIGCYDRRLYAINPDGSLNRTYDTGDWIRSSPAIAGNRLYVGSNDQKLYSFSLPAGSASGPWPQYRFNARRIGRALADPITISGQPIAQTAVLGRSMTLSVTATGVQPLTYQWKKDGIAIAGATGASYTVAAVSAAHAGTYTVTVANSQASVTSDPAIVSVQTEAPGRLTNVSVRTTAGTGPQTLIVGFAVAGSGGKPLLIRGIGPTLIGYGVGDALAAPQMNVVSMSSGATIASNNAWGGGATLAAAFASVGAFELPANSKDTAVLADLQAGGLSNYSVKIEGTNGTTGTALAEVYDLEALTTNVASRLINVSARAEVGTGGNILIAGFAISGNVPKRVLIRAIGPGLTPYGVTGVLANPQLAVYQGNTVFRTNDDWGGTTELTTAFTSVGAFGLPAGSRDAAILIDLLPGTYTAQVSGVGDTTGVGMVEVYEVP